MSIGRKILEFRKKKNFSQEDLAEKIGVSRQTISKWELDETVPDLRQAKLLAKEFGVSLDELADNDVENVLVEKISNTEKLAGMVIKILKIIGVFLVVSFLMNIIAIILFNTFRKNENISVNNQATLNCKMGENRFLITVSDEEFACSFCNEDVKKNLEEFVDFDDIEKTVYDIETYFKNNGGECE